MASRAVCACAWFLLTAASLRLPSRSLRRVARRKRVRDALARRVRPRWELDLGVLAEVEAASAEAAGGGAGGGDYVVCFVNPASGGRRGRAVLRALHRALHPAQVVDLSRPGAAERALATLAPLTYADAAPPTSGAAGGACPGPRLRAVACGGDGTVAWVADLLGAFEASDPRATAPPLAIAPLGTGNDLARILGWGGGLPGALDVDAWLRAWARARPAEIDRWTAAFSSIDGKTAEKRPLLNYLGLGCDAEVALEFHARRKRNPAVFASQVLNKLLYVALSLLPGREKSAANPTGARVGDCLDVFVDGVAVAVPSSARAVVVANINSYMAGGTLWRGSEAAPDDGKLVAVLESTTGRRPAWDIFELLCLAQIELVFHDS